MESLLSCFLLTQYLSMQTPIFQPVSLDSSETLLSKQHLLQSLLMEKLHASTFPAVMHKMASHGCHNACMQHIVTREGSQRQNM